MILSDITIQIQIGTATKQEAKKGRSFWCAQENLLDQYVSGQKKKAASTLDLVLENEPGRVEQALGEYPRINIKVYKNWKWYRSFEDKNRKLGKSQIQYVDNDLA